MIATTPYEMEIIARVKSGELCPRVLAHGDLCGRDIDHGHELDLCRWHSEEVKGLPHHGEESEAGGKHCIRCHHRPWTNAAKRLCRQCQKVTHQRNWRRRRAQRKEIAVGVIVDR